jgi:MarR family transcriptional regulator, organic hydroperoxide resistance regulator
MLSENDLTPVHCGVLNSLYKTDGMSLKALADELSVNASTMTGIIDRMSAKELVERRPDPTDRRALAVFLLPKGRELEDYVTETVHCSNEIFLQDFTEEERIALRRYLLMLIK